MKPIPFIAAALLFAATPAFAAANISCSQLPRAAAFIAKLKPGSNTDQARRHLARAKAAKSNRECVNQLGAVNYFAKRSIAADKAAVRRTGAN